MATVAACGWGMGKARRGGKSGTAIFPKDKAKRAQCPRKWRPLEGKDLPKVTEQSAVGLLTLIHGGKEDKEGQPLQRAFAQ